MSEPYEPFTSIPLDQHLSHSDYWSLQAQEARVAVQRLEAPEARAELLAKADEYDRFAACNREWETWLCKNNSVSSPGESECLKFPAS